MFHVSDLQNPGHHVSFEVDERFPYSYIQFSQIQIKSFKTENVSRYSKYNYRWMDTKAVEIKSNYLYYRLAASCGFTPFAAILPR